MGEDLGYVPMETYERHHTELRTLTTRVTKLEAEFGRIDEHFASDGKFQEAMGKDIGEIKKSISFGIWKVLSLMAAAVVVVGGFIWQASRYPDRSEVDGIRSRVENLQLQEALDKQTISAVEATLGSFKSTLDGLEAKIDRLDTYIRRPMEEKKR